MPIRNCLRIIAISAVLALCRSAPGQRADVVDGPHVIWSSETSAMVWWVQQGKAVHVPITMKRGSRIDAPFLGTEGVTIAPQAPVVEPAEYDGVGEIFVIGDVHGEFMVATDLLRYGGVVDDDLHWAFGTGHLVFVGDIFDRGDRVTETLWLIYRLEQEARTAGGRVHLILGNHEVMPLQNDVRYVHEKYLQTVAPLMSRSYAELFGPETELGRWLRTKHTAIRINDLLFVHGGLSPTIADRGWDLAHINETIRAHLDTPREEIRADEDLHLLFGTEGPLWYRGYFMDWSHYERTTPEQTRRSLAHFRANRIIVAHTGAEEIHSIFGGMVINAHVRMQPRGVAEALHVREGRFERVIVGVRREPLDLSNERWLEAD